MCAKYFAKIDLKITATDKEIKIVGRKFSEVESTLIDPGKLIDAKLFTIN
jgi:hypothetical protein